MQVHTDKLLAWVKAQPTDKVFNFNSASSCGTVQYIHSVWPSSKVQVYFSVYFVDGVRYFFPPELAKVFERLTLQGQTINSTGAVGQHMTFGDFAKAIEEAQNETAPQTSI